jgi:hypothetical protein
VESVKLVADLREAYRAIKAHVQAQGCRRRVRRRSARNEFIVAAGRIGFEDQGAIAQAFGVGTLREAEKQGSYEELLVKLQAIAAARVTVKAEIIPPPEESGPATVAEYEESWMSDVDGVGSDSLEDDRPVGVAYDDYERGGNDSEVLLGLWSDYHAQRSTATRAGVKKIPDMPTGEPTEADMRAAIAELGTLIAAAQRQQALV